jgi:outer membrane protein
MISISKIALACAALVAASGAFAQKAGDNIIGAGIATMSTNASVGTLTHSNSAITPALAGTSATISEESTVSLGWLHMYTDNIGGEFTIGIPPTVTQNLTTPNTPTIGLPAAHQGAATISIWTPTAVAKYFFGTAQDKWRPYVGFGASRVSFHNIKTSAGVATLAGTSADLSSSWAPVYNAGVIYNIDDKWVINGSVSYIPVTTTATFVGSTGTTTGDIKLNTTDYVIRLGYKF